jgi:hypothetical protein
MTHVRASTNPTRRKQDLQHLCRCFTVRPRMCADVRRKSGLVCVSSVEEA